MMQNEKHFHTGTLFGPENEGKPLILPLSKEAKFEKSKGKLCGIAHDNTRRNWTVYNVVPCFLCLTCFWDILVDPLQRMLQSNGKITELKIAAIIAVMFFFLLGSGHAGASPLSYRRNSPGVCGTIDVRNNISNLDVLKGCEVIEGNLHILLMTNRDCNNCNELINNITFPELREVTGYVVFWRVPGLRSFSTLFPNLSVIRGKSLFLNYALVVYELKALQEVGLYSLTHILRGSVAFDKNDNLCFVNTIHWNWIAALGANRHFIKNNRNEKECLECPASINGEKCPLSPSGEPLCWNKEHCQKDFRDCVKDENGACCHESCLGGCRGKLSKDCFVCKNVVFNSECTQECPENMYKYLDRRCVTASECYNIKRPLDLEKRDVAVPFPFRPILDVCTLECPANFSEYEIQTEYGERFQCRSCDGPCKKECPGGIINSISSAQKFSGCTHIKGSLEIQLKFAGNIVAELQESLRSVEEISGYFKVARSLPLLSLDFLKNLKVIRGEILHSNKSAFVLLDNDRLEELWDWETRDKDIRILNGRLSIHHNPKLCFYKIEKFVEIANISDFVEEDATKATNGYKEPCNFTTLEPYIASNEADKVVIKFKQFQHYDKRTLLGYVLYFKKAPDKNVTLYYGRNACGEDGWMDKDIPAPDVENQDDISYELLGLSPFTQYAYFIKTYAISSEKSGARSGIHYFFTNPGVPMRPRALFAYSNSTSEIVISWEPPAEMNGNFTHYVVVVKAVADNPENRNFCLHPVDMTPKKEHKPTLPPPAVKPASDTCVCEVPRKIDKGISEEVRGTEIELENALQNSFFVRRSDVKRSKREMKYAEGSHPQILQKDDIFADTGKSFGVSKKEKQDLVFEVKTNRLVVRDLKYFTNYKIHVQACRAVVEGENGKLANCGPNETYNIRTKKNETADRIPAISLTKHSINGSIEETSLRWEEPLYPNGMILSYKIEYRRVDSDKFRPEVECIERKKFLEQKREYVLRNLAPGNYSVHVFASSLAGNGPYSSSLTFYIRQPSHTSTMDMLGIILGAICGVAFILILYLFWKKKTTGVSKLIANVNPEYVSATYVPDEWEVPRKNIELIRELGQGSFGMVYEGIARDIIQGQPEVRCAVKTVNEVSTDRDRMEFLNEASVMKAFNTHHVVQLLGVVSEGQPTLVVMELMVNGDLKTYLRSHRPEYCEDKKKQPPTLKRIIRMAMEIADGMAYLAAKKFVHRDLAARNCMVAEDLTVKIGDFGMTRDIYETDYYKKGTKGLLPVRWMAPESLKDGVFTTNSDVWSYGIVLWEMVTLASQPYQGLTNDQVLRYVIEGGVMERPENCPNKLYDLMKLCWQHKPSARPHFMSFVTRLLPDASPEFCEKSYYHSPEGRELRAHLEATENLDTNYQVPETPLQLARDIEDFSVGGSDNDLDEEEEEADLDVELALISPQRGLLSSVARPDTWSKAQKKPTVASMSSSDSSRGSKDKGLLTSSNTRYVGKDYTQLRGTEASLPLSNIQIPQTCVVVWNGAFNLPPDNAGREVRRRKLFGEIVHNFSVQMTTCQKLKKRSGRKL